MMIATTSPVVRPISQPISPHPYPIPTAMFFLSGLLCCPRTPLLLCVEAIVYHAHVNLQIPYLPVNLAAA